MLLRVALLLLLPGLLLAQTPPAARLTEGGGVTSSDNTVHVRVAADRAGPDRSDVVVRLVAESPECQFAGPFDAAIQMGESAFFVKRMSRVAQATGRDGSCEETLQVMFGAAEFTYMASAGRVVMYLPPTTLTWASGLPSALRSVAPAGAAPLVVESDSLRNLAGRLRTLTAAGRAQDARREAEAAAPGMVTRPADDVADFYAAFAEARRASGDLDGAVVCYQVAWRVAFALAPMGERAGHIADGLSVVRRLQKNFEAATEESERALRLLRPFDRAYAEALRNRARLLADQDNFVGAIDYSDRALVILRELLKAEPSALAPYLAENDSYKARRRN